jgi:hypothetical protein
MAVIVADSNNGAYTTGGLSVANGFYRAEAFNMGMFSTTTLALTTARTIPVTFANAGNCQGLIISLQTTSGQNLKSVIVKLQENVASVWTDRASVTLTETQINNGNVTVNSNSTVGEWIVAFEGGTFPYAVTTAGSTWRFEVSQGTGTNNWNLRTSDGTNPFYITWCDNQVSFANNDCVIAKNKVSIDQTATFKGVLGTGDTTRSVCALGVKQPDATPDNVACFIWDGSAARTLTLDGLMVFGSFSGFRAGTSASRISVANQGILDVILATSGTTTNTGITNVPHTAVTARNCRSSFFFYGEIPTVEDAILAADANTGQANIVTTVSTGWANGDKVVIGAQNVKGNGERFVYTVSSVSSTTITLTSNITTNVRKAKGRVIRLNGYGFIIQYPATGTGITIEIAGKANFVMSGVQNKYFQLSDSALLSNTGPTFQIPVVTERCSFEGGAGFTTLARAWTTLGQHEQPVTFDHVNVYCMSLGNISSTAGSNLFLTITNCITLIPGPVNGGTVSLTSTHIAVVTDNVFENSNNQFVDLRGVGSSFLRNRFYGGSSGVGALRCNGMADYVLGGNTYDNCALALHLSAGTNVNCVDTDSIFGADQANTSDVNFLNGSYNQYILASPTGNVGINVTSLPTTQNTSLLQAEGAAFKVSDFNDTANDDRGYFTNGFTQRTGTGLSDTTVRTSPGFALRVQPTVGTSFLNWPNLTTEREIPTGNIQNKTMTISVWIYINNAAYYAGTHTKPTLKVKYDNTTTISTVATATVGSWQQLVLNFTPVTTFGNIQVWICAATDATGSNAYFYIDDLNVAYPAGVIVDNGTLNSWTGGLPVWPPISIIGNQTNFWDELTSNHSAAGSYGTLVPQIDIKTDDNTALILTK